MATTLNPSDQAQLLPNRQQQAQAAAHAAALVLPRPQSCCGVVTPCGGSGRSPLTDAGRATFADEGASPMSDKCSARLGSNNKGFPIDRDREAGSCGRWEGLVGLQLWRSNHEPGE